MFISAPSTTASTVLLSEGLKYSQPSSFTCTLTCTLTALEIHRLTTNIHSALKIFAGVTDHSLAKNLYIQHSLLEEYWGQRGSWHQGMNVLKECWNCKLEGNYIEDTGQITSSGLWRRKVKTWSRLGIHTPPYVNFYLLHGNIYHLHCSLCSPVKSSVKNTCAAPVWQVAIFLGMQYLCLRFCGGAGHSSVSVSFSLYPAVSCHNKLQDIHHTSCTWLVST